MNKSALLPPLLSMTYFSTSVLLTTSKLDSWGTIVNKNSFITTPCCPPFIFVQQIDWNVLKRPVINCGMRITSSGISSLHKQVTCSPTLLHANQALNKQCMKLFPDSQQTYAMRTSKRTGTGRCVIAWPSGKAAPLRVGLCPSPLIWWLSFTVQLGHTPKYKGYSTN